MSGLIPPGGGPAEQPESHDPPPPRLPQLPSVSGYPGPTSAGVVPASSDKGLGWTGLGLALALCVPCLPLAGVVIAIITLARRRFQPRWAAVLALVLGVGATVLQVAMVPSALEGVREGANESLERDTDRARESGEARRVSILKLQVGDCFSSPGMRGLTETDEQIETETVTLIPCESAHDLEVYRAFELVDGDFPGQRKIDKLAERCLEVFDEFIGKPYGSSRFEVYYLFPTARSWRLLDDHTVSCLVGHPRKQVSGSLKNRRR